MSRKSLQPYFRTQAEALQGLVVDTLKTIARLLPGTPTLPTRKDELIKLLLRHCATDKIFNHLSDMEKNALAETAHHTAGAYDRTRFMARYGRDPFPREIDYHRQTTLLDLFIVNGTMPQDLQERVKKIFPQPAAVTITTCDNLPPKIVQHEKKYNGTSKLTVEVRKRPTVREAIGNFTIVLRVMDSGKLKVSSARRFPTQAAMTLLAEQLMENDWYEQPCYGGIQSFAWPLLLQAGGFAATSASALSLTSKGKKVLNGKIPVHEAIRDAWNAWKTRALIDEFSRVSAIKGQTARGRVMTSALRRRAAVIEALAECPEGTWISVEELGRFMRAESRGFAITHNSWGLYIGDRNYGALGYEGFDSWEILQERYIKTVIMEYAATLGIVDIGYAPPEDVARNFNDLWGTGELEYLSSCDGLLFFRINDLGAWVLGGRKNYTPAPEPLRQCLDVLPNFDIAVTDLSALPKTDRMFLDGIAMSSGKFLWKINRQTLMTALEKGASIDTIRNFLQSRAKNGIPQTVDALLKETGWKTAEITFEGRACLLACKDTRIHDLLRLDDKLKQYTLAAQNAYIILLSEKEQAFFRRMRELGYSLPVAHRIAD
jgi:hypothetical protein